MEKITITASENTCNDVNTLKLIGYHKHKGCVQLAYRTHNHQTGKVERCAGIGVANREWSAEEWPKAVQKVVQEFLTSCAMLDEHNAVADQIGRELFASLEIK